MHVTYYMPLKDLFMKLCKKSYEKKGKQVVLTGENLVFVIGGTNGNGLDPTDEKTKAKAEAAPIYKTKSSGG